MTPAAGGPTKESVGFETGRIGGPEHGAGVAAATGPGGCRMRQRGERCDRGRRLTVAAPVRVAPRIPARAAAVIRHVGMANPRSKYDRQIVGSSRSYRLGTVPALWNVPIRPSLPDGHSGFNRCLVIHNQPILPSFPSRPALFTCPTPRGRNRINVRIGTIAQLHAVRCRIFPALASRGTAFVLEFDYAQPPAMDLDDGPRGPARGCPQRDGRRSVISPGDLGISSDGITAAGRIRPSPGGLAEAGVRRFSAATGRDRDDCVGAGDDDPDAVRHRHVVQTADVHPSVHGAGGQGSAPQGRDCQGPGRPGRDE